MSKRFTVNLDKQNKGGNENFTRKERDFVEFFEMPLDPNKIPDIWRKEKYRGKDLTKKKR